ncbi:hypothetical protein [Nostoc sphaeroides]|jgi:hypothetical protein|uniref:Uncharacterized protein n=1 Tax=Nostoc sphaeroides CCNUC1 TaxID=2653204 RepID=A0A5P8WDW7_9NOSO|nr:hypothetical protein [Nostoc sphaeroides]MCC5632166.1 hypothetical protein [Nostoc sphaeroides CHAB 2801]QFS50089.1 hypothetical protein GXM_07583 [Nostoc sphaeroides CCNUC1]
MSHINNQTQDLYSIELVQDLDHEASATISGGGLDLSTSYNGKGDRVDDLTKGYSSLGYFNNKVSWYELTGKKDWYAYTGKNFTGTRYLLKAGSKSNLRGYANNNWESVKPV